MEQYRWLIFALLAAVFAAIVNVLTKRALDKADHTIALCVQSTVMLTTLLAATTFMGRWSKAGDTPKWALGLVALSGIAGGLSWLFGYRALQLSQVAKTAPIDKLSMPLAVVLAMIFLHERPSPMNWVGVALMTIGAFFVAQGGK